MSGGGGLSVNIFLRVEIFSERVKKFSGGGLRNLRGVVEKFSGSGVEKLFFFWGGGGVEKFLIFGGVNIFGGGG